MRLTLLVLTILCFMPAVANAYEEGAGLIHKDSEGALPKSLWYNQNRSEIAYLLQNLPADAPLRSLQQIKADMLLSVYDTTVIKNDIKPKNGHDLLTLRLNKLIEMGLWDQALRLYTALVNDPEDNSDLAETGILLTLLKKGLGSACLEEKVFSKRFDKNLFWTQLGTICDIELGSALLSTADFGGSQILKDVYADDGFKIPAGNINNLSTLELALLLAKGRVDYTSLEINKQTHPRTVKFFLEDTNFPSSSRGDLTQIAIQKVILPESPLSAPLQEYALSLDNRTQEEMIKLVSHRLKLEQNVPFPELKKLEKLASENQENYFYLQCLGIIQPINEKIALSEEQLSASIALLSNENEKKVNLLKSLLDKSPEFSNNPPNVYEKHVRMNSDGSFSALGNPLDWLDKTINKRYAGLTLLIMLSNIENNTLAKSSVDISEEKTFNMLKSLSKVGLIDQSHQIAREELANLMVLNKN